MIFCFVTLFLLHMRHPSGYFVDFIDFGVTKEKLEKIDKISHLSPSPFESRMEIFIVRLGF